MTKLQIFFLVLLIIGFASSQTYIKYNIDSFAVTQDTIVRSSINGVNVEQTEAATQGGGRIVSGFLSGSVSVGGGQFSAQLGNIAGNSLYLTYRNSENPVDRSDASGVQFYISNSVIFDRFSVSIETDNGMTTKDLNNFPAHPSGIIIQVPFSDFPQNREYDFNTQTFSPVAPNYALVTGVRMSFDGVYGPASIVVKEYSFYASTAPVNSIITGAIGVVPTETIVFDNSDSPDDAILTGCSDLESASSFLWYKIVPTNTIRIISVDTCNTPFDTVIAVFSGTSESNLQLDSCNDDASNLGPECNPTSSFLSDINIAAGETVYIVVGGYFDTTSQSADAGEGSISFTLLQSDDVSCDLESLVQQREIIISALDASNQNIGDQFDSLETALTTVISEGDTDILSLISSTSSSISDQVDDVHTNVNSIISTLASVSTKVESIESVVNAVESTLEETSAQVSSINTIVTDLATSVDSLTDNVDSSFINVGELLDILQSTSNEIKTDVATLQTSVSSVSSSVDDVSDQVSGLNTLVGNSFSSLSTQVGVVNTAVGGVSTQLTTSTSAVQTSIAAVKLDTASSLTILTPLQNNIVGIVKNDMFTQTYLNYLSDSSAEAPLNIRMPNAFGGKLDDIATAVVSLYNGLKASALAIGIKGSFPCNSNSFCNYFLVTAEPAYVDAMSKYNSNIATRKFKTAYSNLQKAYTSLYPSGW